MSSATTPAAKILPEVDLLRGERDALRREAEMDEEDRRELLDDTRQHLLRCFPEMDRLGIAMLHRNAHVGEWSVPTLAEHVATRLSAAHTPAMQKPSEVVTVRMGELRARLADIARIIEGVDQRCMAADGPVTPTLKEMRQEEISRIYALAIGTEDVT